MIGRPGHKLPSVRLAFKTPLAYQLLKPPPTIHPSILDLRFYRGIPRAQTAGRILVGSLKAPSDTHNPRMKLTRKAALLFAPSLLSWALLGSVLHAQEPPPSAPRAPTETASPWAWRPQAATPRSKQRVAGLEAYLKNTNPADALKTAKDKVGDPAIPTGLTSPSVWNSRAWSQCLDDDQRRAGAFHDTAGPGAFLRRPRAEEKRPERVRAMPWLRRHGHHPLVGLWLQPGLRQELRQQFPGRQRILLLQGSDERAQHRLRACVGLRRNVFACY